MWVTGAAGFLGAAVCARLLRDGHRVRPLCREDAASGPLAALAGSERLLPILACDLCHGSPEPPVGEAPPWAILHFAAERPEGGDPGELEASAQRNRRIDANVFAAAAATRAGVVYASGGIVYGAGHGQRFTEDGPVAPEIPYGRAKLASEREGAARLEAAGLSFAALRISAPYGPGQRADTVVHRFLARALHGDNLTYHGTGSRMQDFIYVDDVADAVARCLATRAGGVFNIASGQPVTMKELAALVVEVTASDAAIQPSGAADPQEGRTALYSIGAAERILGWTPATPLRRGLELWRDHLEATPASRP